MRNFSFRRCEWATKILLCENRFNANNPQTIDDLKTNIRQVIVEILPEMCPVKAIAIAHWSIDVSALSSWVSYRTEHLQWKHLRRRARAGPVSIGECSWTLCRSCLAQPWTPTRTLHFQTLRIHSSYSTPRFFQYMSVCVCVCMQLKMLLLGNLVSHFTLFFLRSSISSKQCSGSSFDWEVSRSTLRRGLDASIFGSWASDGFCGSRSGRSLKFWC